MALRPPNIDNYIQNNIRLQSKMKYDKISIRYKGLKKEHTMKVYVIRHGESETNREKKWTGWLDVNLT